MKISGSILAVNDNYMQYAKQLKYVNIDFLHIDIFENSDKFPISNLLNFDDTYLPLDVHLIFENLEDKDVDIINRAKISYLNIQYENIINKNIIPKLAETVDANFGLAFTSKTSLDEIEKNLKYCKQVLFMCSEPGVSGASFDKTNYERVRIFHKEHPQYLIMVDGGMDDAKIKKMDEAGASIAVSGSFLSKNIESIDVNAYQLKYYGSERICVEQKMIPLASLPVVKRNEPFPGLINIMNKYRLGIALVTDDEVLSGIIADGDVRRGFAQYGKEIFEKKAEDLMNPKPYIVNPKTLIKEIYHDIANMHKGIEVIPICDGTKLIGAIDLKLGK